MIHRREMLPILTAPLAAPSLFAQAAPVKRKGRIKQGITRGVFGRGTMTLDDMCREAARLGIQGFDLVEPKDWLTLKKYGLVSSMYPPGPGGSIPDAL